MIAPLLVVLTQLQPLPPNLVALDSPEGRKLLDESQAKADFIPLVSHFLTQKTPAFCGVASSVMVLDSLDLAAPTDPQLAPFREFTQDNVFGPQTGALNAGHVAKGGLTVEQVALLLKANGADATATLASDATVDAFRAELKRNLATAGDYLVVDFSRPELGQDMGAHWSPLAAYHEGSDRVLMLDVARMRYPPSWVPVEALFKAMNTTDLDSGKSRGWVIVKKAAGAPGRITIGPMSHRLWRVGGAIALGIFLFGAGVGALLMRWRLRRRLAP